MNEEVLKKLYDSGSKYFDLPMFEIFKADMSDDGKLEKFRDSMSQHYSIPDFKTFKNDLSSIEKQAKPKEEEVVKTDDVELVGEVVPMQEKIISEVETFDWKPSLSAKEYEALPLMDKERANWEKFKEIELKNQKEEVVKFL